MIIIKKICTLLLFALLASCNGCESIRYYTVFQLKNQSGHDCKVYFCMGPYDIYPGGVYPDTFLTLVDPAHLYPIKANYGPYIHRHDKIGELFSRMPTDTMSIFWFHSDTLAKYSWEEIQRGYKILARYDLHMRDFDDPGFSIPYPPDETMEGRKMYIPK